MFFVGVSNRPTKTQVAEQLLLVSQERLGQSFLEEHQSHATGGGDELPLEEVGKELWKWSRLRVPIASGFGQRAETFLLFWKLWAPRYLNYDNQVILER